MEATRRHHVTPEEYLAFERESPEKHEYLDGEVLALGGASERHNLLVTNVVRELSTQLKGRPCRVYANDMRVKVDDTGLYTYPDVVALCGEPRFDDPRRDTLLNPSAVLEVLSGSTEGYDRGEKFAHYRKLASLQEYVLISQGRLRVECYTRQEDGRWLLSEASRLEDEVALPSIGCRLVLAEIYDKVELDDPPRSPARGDMQ